MEAVLLAIVATIALGFFVLGGSVVGLAWLVFG